MTSRPKMVLPPTVPLTINRDQNAGIPYRAESLGLSNDDLMGMISHTPPVFTPGSLELPLTKRSRSGSISGRLRSASDLEERGVIDRYQKGVLKDLIISGNEELKDALENFENGDSSALEALMDSGILNRKASLDLLEDLDFGFLNVGELCTSPHHEPYAEPPTQENLDDWDDLKFEAAFADISTKPCLPGLSVALGESFVNSLPSMGMGITPPNPWGLSEFLDHKDPGSDPFLEQEMKAPRSPNSTCPIGIPGSSKSHNDSMAPKTFVGAYSPESRQKRIQKFLDKRQKRVWTKKVKYDVRKNFADSRLRVKGRFVKKEDEQLLRELLSMT